MSAKQKFLTVLYSVLFVFGPVITAPVHSVFVLPRIVVSTEQPTPAELISVCEEMGGAWMYYVDPTGAQVGDVECEFPVRLNVPIGGEPR